MYILRKTSQSNLYLWVFVLSVALICAQGVTIHIHAVDHDHLKLHNHHHDSLEDQQTIADHTHFSIAHLSSDTSHGSHHDQIVYENVACPDCLLLKVANETPFIALLTAL